jgi:hypothetical protein
LRREEKEDEVYIGLVFSSAVVQKTMVCTGRLKWFARLCGSSIASKNVESRCRLKRSKKKYLQFIQGTMLIQPARHVTESRLAIGFFR